MGRPDHAAGHGIGLVNRLLAELRRHKALAGMRLLRPGNRLSITPVTESEWKYIAKLV